MQELNDFRKENRKMNGYEKPLHSLSNHFEGRKPYCMMHVGPHEVGIYDFGVSAEGFGIVLAAYIDPPDNRTWFRRTAVLKDADGYYIRKGGYKFYFVDADYITSAFEEFIARIEEV